jgi:hypothetical protein
MTVLFCTYVFFSLFIFCFFETEGHRGQCQNESTQERKHAHNHSPGGSTILRRGLQLVLSKTIRIFKGFEEMSFVFTYKSYRVPLKSSIQSFRIICRMLIITTICPYFGKLHAL